MTRLKSPDWAALIGDLMASGITRTELAKRLDLAAMSDKLIRHYENGGQPSFPRGDAILALWSEVMGQSDAFVEMVDWQQRLHIASRSDESTLKKTCPTCGQVMRSHILQRWQQMDMHKQQFGGLENWPPRGQQCAVEV